MCYEYKCNTSIITFRQGSIIDSNAEVIVSSDNAGLQMSQGVSRAIIDAAGDEIDHDLSKISNCNLGDVIVTTAGKLKQRYVFHCIADKRGSKRNTELLPVIIDQTVGHCFQLMPLLGVSSISFPAIGTGAIGLTIEDVASSMLKAIAYHLQKTNRCFQVEIALIGSDDVRLFSKIAKELPYFEMPETTALESIKESSGKAFDIFISYCWRDQNFALDLCRHLDSLKLNYFIDRNIINGGDDHKDTIIKALKRTKMVLFLSSEESNKSVYVRQEIANATEMRIPIIPLRIDLTPYADSILFDLINSLYIDCTKGLGPKWEELKRYLLVKGIINQDDL